MSYFVSNPSSAILRALFKLLTTLEGNMIETLQSVVECIKNDLREEYGVAHPKILTACDEVGKSASEKNVSDLCSLMDDHDDLECFFTGLTHWILSIKSRRTIKNVRLPLLSFSSSLALVQSFIFGSDSVQISSKLARLSGGHPRTI